MSLQFDPTVITGSLPELASGFATTIAVWIGGVLIGLAIGFAIAQ
jgi:polar amino acid transport system permease protein